MKEKIKLTTIQIKNYEWVLENINNLNWIKNDEANPYLLIDGWLGGCLDFEIQN
jgi:hypothetical protein